MRILIKGYYGFGNLGDDILLMVSHSILRELYPSADFFVYSNFTENLVGYEQNPGYNEYIHRLLQGDVTIIDWTYKGDFDLLFNGGGGIYFDHTGGSIILKILNPLIIKALGCHGIYKLDNFLRRLFHKRRQVEFTKHIGAGIGLGDFASGAPSFLRKMSDLGSYQFLWVRDDYSIAKLKSYSFDRLGAKYTDLSFLNKYWLPAGIKCDSSVATVNTIGVVLMGLPKDAMHVYNEIKLFESKAANRGFRVIFFSLDENHDKEFISYFKGQELIVWRPNHTSLADFLQKMADCQIMISARAHGAILAAMLGCIPVCLKSSVKLEEVAAMFPNSGMLKQMDVSSEELLNCLDWVSSRYREYTKNLVIDIKKNITLAKDGLAALKMYLNE